MSDGNYFVFRVGFAVGALSVSVLGLEASRILIKRKKAKLEKGRKWVILN